MTKRTNNDLQNTTQKTNDRTLRSLLSTVVNSYTEGLVVPAPLVTPFILITGNHLHSWLPNLNTGLFFSGFFKKPLHEVGFKAENVQEERNTVGSQRNSDYLLKNISTKHNKYVVNQKLEHLNEHYIAVQFKLAAIPNMYAAFILIMTTNIAVV